MRLRDRLARIPPWMVAALARECGKPVQLPTLAAKARLSETFVRRLVSEPNWERVPVGVLLDFCEACGVEPMHLKRETDYLRKSLRSQKPFRHLTQRQRKRVLFLATQ